MDKNTALKEVIKYKDAILKEFSPKKIFLFGSYSNGTQKESSDIDVGILFDKLEGNYLENIAKLWSIAWQVNLKIEPHLLDTTQDPSGFVQHIINSGQEVYSA